MRKPGVGKQNDLLMSLKCFKEVLFHQHVLSATNLKHFRCAGIWSLSYIRWGLKEDCCRFFFFLKEITPRDILECTPQSKIFSGEPFLALRKFYVKLGFISDSLKWDALCFSQQGSPWTLKASFSSPGRWDDSFYLIELIQWLWAMVCKELNRASGG